jgi:hypothetical protein
LVRLDTETLRDSDKGVSFVLEGRDSEREDVVAVAGMARMREFVV